MADRRRLTASTFVLIAAAFLTPMALHGPTDQEEHYLGLFSSLVHFEHLQQGRFLFWYDKLGLGTPLPIGHDFDAHPVFALWPLLGFGQVMLLFWLVHLATGTAYVWRLCRFVGIDGRVAGACALTFLLSTPTLNYIYADDWPSVAFGWLIYPVLVFYALQALTGQHSVSRGFSIVRLAVLLALTAVTVHQGHAVILFAMFGVFVLAIGASRLRGLLTLAIAAALALAMSAESLYFVLTEAARFPPDVMRDSQPGYAPADYLRVLARPLGPELLSKALALSPSELWATYLDQNRGTRVPFFGGVFFLAALAGAVVALTSWRRPRQPDLRVDVARAATLCFALSVAGSLLPDAWAPSAVSGLWLFRDPAIFYGLLLAGLLLSGSIARGFALPRPLIASLLALHSSQMLLAAVPAMVVGFNSPAPSAYWWLGQPLGAGAWIAQHAAGSERRLYLSPGAERAFRERSIEGVYALTDLSLLGVGVVNGRFKGTAMDQLYRSSRLMNGQIVGERDTTRNGPLLDLLGVTHVLLTPDEYADAGAYRHLVGLSDPAPAANRLARASEPDSKPAVTQPTPSGCVTPALGALVRGVGHEDVFLWDGTRRLVPDAATMAARGWTAAQVQVIDRDCLGSLQLGEPVTRDAARDSTAAAKPADGPAAAPIPGCPTVLELEGVLVRPAGGDDDIYIQGGRRREVPGADTLAALGLTGAPRRTVPPACLAAIPTGPSLSAGIQASPPAPPSKPSPEPAAPDAGVEFGLVLLRNPTAWPRATLLPANAAELRVGTRSDCGGGGLLCRDVGAFAALRLRDDVHVEGDNGRLAVRVDPRDTPRLLLFGTQYRPEWQASADGRPLRTLVVAGALLGVELPPGTTSVDVRFDPAVRRLLLIVASIVFVLAVAYAIRDWLKAPPIAPERPASAESPRATAAD